MIMVIIGNRFTEIGKQASILVDHLFVLFFVRKLEIVHPLADFCIIATLSRRVRSAKMDQILSLLKTSRGVKLETGVKCNMPSFQYTLSAL